MSLELLAVVDAAGLRPVLRVLPGPLVHPMVVTLTFPTGARETLTVAVVPEGDLREAVSPPGAPLPLAAFGLDATSTPDAGLGVLLELRSPGAVAADPAAHVWRCQREEA